MRLPKWACERKYFPHFDKMHAWLWNSLCVVWRWYINCVRCDAMHCNGSEKKRKEERERQRAGRLQFMWWKYIHFPFIHWIVHSANWINILAARSFVPHFSFGNFCLWWRVHPSFKVDYHPASWFSMQLSIPLKWRRPFIYCRCSGAHNSAYRFSACWSVAII